MWSLERRGAGQVGLATLYEALCVLGIVTHTRVTRVGPRLASRGRVCTGERVRVGSGGAPGPTLSRDGVSVSRP